MVLTLTKEAYETITKIECIFSRISNNLQTTHHEYNGPIALISAFMMDMAVLKLLIGFRKTFILKFFKTITSLGMCEALSSTALNPLRQQ